MYLHANLATQKKKPVFHQMAVSVTFLEKDFDDFFSTSYYVMFCFVFVFDADNVMVDLEHFKYMFFLFFILKII